MSIEGGARAGLIAPDDTTYDYLRGRPQVPQGAEFDKAVARWRKLPTDRRREVRQVARLRRRPTSRRKSPGARIPGQVAPVTGRVPEAGRLHRSERSEDGRQRARLHGPRRRRSRSRDLKLDRVFIGSCTNARIEDLRAAAAVVNGHKVAGHVNAMVVPGSGLVKQQAEKEGLDRVFKDAGFEWREAGCSMCLAMNPDKLEPGERCASTSQPQLRRPPRPRRPHAPGLARDGRGGGVCGAFCGCSGLAIELSRQ